MTCIRVIEAAGCRVLVRPKGTVTPKRLIVVTGKTKKGYDGCARAAQTQLLVTMERWAAGKPLPPSKYKPSEGRYTNGGQSVLLRALAAPGTRFYGWVETIRGVEVFSLVECDTNKKQKDADQATLQRAGKKALALQQRYREVQNEAGT